MQSQEKFVMLPCPWILILLIVIYLSLILVATGMLTDYGKAQKLVLFISVLTVIPLMLFILSLFCRKGNRGRARLYLYLSLATHGFFFVIISAILFSFYFEGIEIVVKRRGLHIGLLGWSLVALCVFVLVLIKLRITKLREDENIQLGLCQ